MSISSASLSLFRSLLRNAKKVDNYNFREYSIRRIKIGFQNNRSLTGYVVYMCDWLFGGLYWLLDGWFVKSPISILWTYLTYCFYIHFQRSHTKPKHNYVDGQTSPIHDYNKLMKPIIINKLISIQYKLQQKKNWGGDSIPRG